MKRTFSETLLSSVINEALNQTERGFDMNLAEFFHDQYTFSSMHNQCLTNEHVKDRMGCCLPNDVKHLYQVMIRNKKLHLFIKRENYTTTKEQIMPPKLPPIKSLIHDMRPIYDIPVEIIYVNSIQDIHTHCGNKYFNGTLHAVGRSSAGNIYHAIGDNFAPLISQIVLDYFLEPSLLHQPRMALTGFQPVNHEQSHKHLQMMQDIMTHKSMNLAEMDEMCFRRVIWGHGVHVLYYDTVVKLRRLTADFAHNFVKKKYNLALPSEFRVDSTHRISSSSSSTSSSGTTSTPSRTQSSSDRTLLPTNTSNNSLNTQYLSTVSSSSSYPFPHLMQQYSKEFDLLHGLKIVLFTRGNSGRGRSIQGEELIINAFRKLGAKVASCCDFGVASLETQLAYAAHADVMMGLHGAAMVHGFFMPQGAIILELKTQFGFEKALFNIVADSRAGYYGQVDVREYMVKGGGGHRLVDTSLVERTVKTLLELLKLKYNSNGSSIYGSVSVDNRDDHHNNNNNNNIYRKRSSHMKGVINGNINSQHKHSHSRHPRNNNNQHNQKISAKNNSNNNRHLLLMLTNEEATNSSTSTGMGSDSIDIARHYHHTYSSNSIGGHGQFFLLQPLSIFTATVTAKNGSHSIVYKPRLDAVSGPIQLLLPPLLNYLPSPEVLNDAKSQSPPSSTSMSLLSSPLPSLLSLTSQSSSSLKSTIHQEGLNHILGPTLQHLSSTCRSTVLYAFRKQILHNADDQLHCGVCTPFNADRRS